MGYSLEKIVRGLRSNIRIYWILFLELTLCFTLTFIGINQYMASQARQREIQNQTEDRLYLRNQSQTTISPEDLSIIEGAMVNGEEFIYLQNKQVSMMVNQDFLNIPTYLVNHHFMEKSFEEAPKDNTLYTTSSEFLNAVQDQKVTFFEIEVDQTDQELSIAGQPVNLEFIKSPQNLKVVTSYIQKLDMDLSRASFWPMESFGKVLNPRNEAAIELIAIDHSTRPRQDIINELNKVTELKYDFLDAQVRETYESGVASLSEMVTVFAFCGGVSLITIMVGIVSLLYIFMNQRKRAMEISYLFGASVHRIRMEFFFEILLIVLGSSLLSGIIAYFIQPAISSIYFDIPMTGLTMGLIWMLPLIICGLTVLLVQSEISFVTKKSIYH